MGPTYPFSKDRTELENPISVRSAPHLHKPGIFQKKTPPVGGAFPINKTDYQKRMMRSVCMPESVLTRTKYCPAGIAFISIETRSDEADAV